MTDPSTTPAANESTSTGFSGLGALPPSPTDAEGPEGPEGDVAMSFTDHIADLRKRLIRASLAIVGALVGCWSFVEYLRAIVNQPLSDAWARVGLEGKPTLQVLGVLDVFLTDVRIALTGAVFVAAPVIFYQLWMFISPGLYQREKRYVVPFVMTGAIMFAVGAVFCYTLVLPFATEWFLAYPSAEADGSGVRIAPQYSFPEYTTYTTKLLLAFGLIFEFPLAIFFMAAAGILTHRTLLQHWKISVLLIFIVAAVVTPPDPITLLLMAIPMVGLFFVSVGVAYLASKPHLEAAKRVSSSDGT